MTTDITELSQRLKAAAEKAGADGWQAKKISGDFYVIRKGSYKRECGYLTYQSIAEIDHKPTRYYVALANPANVIALVEALEKAQQRIAELEREQEHLRPVGVMSEKAYHRLENRESRFIALWPRPGIFLPRKRPEDGVIVYARTTAAVGTKVEAE